MNTCLAYAAINDLCQARGGGLIVLGNRYSIVDYGIWYFALCIGDALETRAS